MKISWQIFNNWGQQQTNILRQYGIHTENGCHSIILREEVYERLKPFLDEWNVSRVKGVRFSDKEVLTAECCVMERRNMVGYPMPDNDGKYLSLTYESCSICSYCDVGKRQKNDFRIKIIPKYPLWGLNWGFDEFFANINSYNQVFKPLGIGCRTVRLHKDDTIINTIVQIVLPETSESLDLRGYESRVCPQCGSIKYDAQIHDFFSSHKTPLAHMYKSREYFGDGCSANKKIFVSAELRDRMIKYGLMKARNFIPCKSRE